MTKLTLSVDDLRVESFIPDPRPAGPRGTVRAHVRETWGCNTQDRLACYTGRCLSDACESDFCETQDPGACYTANPEWGTCQAVYTCPECASPPIETEPCVVGFG